MSVNEQARTLMHRHHQLIKNRQQTLLARTAAEVGMPADAVLSWNHIQGKPSYNSVVAYEPSHAALS
jgi:hypothetical protein